MESSTKFPDCFHRVTIKGLCVRDGKLLLVRESESLSNKWELPGGGLDLGEEIRTGFEREVAEEMGLKIRKMDAQPRYVWTCRFENWRGLEWFYSMIIAYRVEFEDLNFTPSNECVEIRFFSPEELVDLNVGRQLIQLKKLFNPADFPDPF